MEREIKLSGSEISVLKTLGTSGSQMYGGIMLDRLKEMLPSELIDTLGGLMAEGYVLSNRVNIRRIEEVETAFFRVNPAEAKDLRRALRPGKREKERRRPRRG